MALQPSGFQVTELPRAPNFPSEIGRTLAVDPEAIYRGALAGMQQRQQLIAESNQAQNLALAQQRLDQQGEIQNDRNVLAQQAAGQQQQQAVAKLAQDQQRIDANINKPPGLTVNARDDERLRQELSTPEYQTFLRRKYGLESKPSSAAIKYMEVVGPDGTPRLVAVNPREAGAEVIGTGEEFGAGVSPGNATPKASETNGSLPAADLLQGQSAYEKTFSTATADEKAKHIADLETKLPKVQSSLIALDRQNKNTEGNIDRAIDLANNYSAGIGSFTRAIPGTEGRTLAGLISTIKSSVGIDKLLELRQNSPTGGALGNVSDRDIQLLTDSIASLDQGLSVPDLIRSLQQIKQFRQDALKNAREALERDFAPALKAPTSSPASDQTVPRGTAPTSPDNIDAIISYARAHPELPQSAKILQAHGQTP